MLRIAVRVGGSALAGLTLALCALWLWSGTANSLATSLSIAARWLPTGQILQTGHVKGALQSGGTVEWLRWQQGDLRVEVHDLELQWSLRDLLNGELRVSRLAAGHVRVEGNNSDSAPSAPPIDLILPLQVDARVAIATLEWQGATSATATDLAFHYIFDSTFHRLEEGHGRFSSGTYQFAATLEALAPMALEAHVNGSVSTALPGREAPWDTAVEASVAGALAGNDATLDVRAALTPSSGQSMQAKLTARVQPWKSQPVVRAQARWRDLELEALWPRAPLARLSGEALVQPDGVGWLADLKVSNAQSGPWNERRLPLERLDAQLAYAQGQWVVRSLGASGAGGRLSAQGAISAGNAASGWQGRVTLTGVDAAGLDSRWTHTPLDGQLHARQVDGGVVFKTEVVGSGHRNAKTVATGSAMHLQRLAATGLWKAPLLKIDELTVETDDAKLEGQFSIHTVNLATSGEASLRLPGATASAKGQISSAGGDGTLQVLVADAALVKRWLARLPGMPASFEARQVKGAASMQARWKGGWRDRGRALTIEATARVPAAEWSNPGATGSAPWQLQNGELEIAGTLGAMTLKVQGQAAHQSQRWTLRAGASIGQVDASTWRAGVEKLHATFEDRLRTGVWSLRLADPMTGVYQYAANRRSVETSGGALRLTGPNPGEASLQWEGVRWEQTGAAEPTGRHRTQWSTRGRLSDLPLAWLDTFSPTPLADLGLRGNIMLGGQWDVQDSGALQVRGHVERTSGDLQLLGEGDESALLSAGLRQARIEVVNDGDRLNARLRWDSERAGQVQADFSTRLRLTDAHRDWPDDAPVTGQIKAELPRVGVWSVLAPPGWRLRGTLSADAVLTGTRSSPLLRGQLNATDLALRSVVDGMDFSGGTLRTRLNGEQLVIEEFTMNGAGGSTGGRLSAKGLVQWPRLEADDSVNSARFLQQLRLEMDATANALRVSARSDRRLVVSGNLSARLAAAKLGIRGALTADQALFVMPEDSTPTLGDDVVVRKPAALASGNLAPLPGSAGGVAAAKPPTLQIQPELTVTLDLGKDFQVRGSGLATLLEGTVQMRNAGRAFAPQLTGTLRTVGGSYKAYGQRLDIEEGLLRFTGPYDNPALDILAIRPNLTQRVGVQISGRALSPAVRLYADPDLPDSEKLAWLVLGRSGANGGAESAMLQQAALALLGNRAGATGQIANALGLDEITLRGGGGDSAFNSGADSGAAASTLAIGKRISRDFYLAYERSLAGTVGTLSIFYDLSRRFTLRGQTGEQSAADLIFTLRYE